MQVMLKMKSIHVGNTFTKKKKSKAFYLNSYIIISEK